MRRFFAYLRDVWHGPLWWLLPLAALLLPAILVFIFLKVMPDTSPFDYTPF